MKTAILKSTPQGIEDAASLIKQGGIVAFPTETVYGLGASVFDESAIRSIFKAKGRPQDNPLIIHISKRSDVELLALDIPLHARRLMDQFWPGPLTLVLSAKHSVPLVARAGLPTVAIRMPQSKIARSLISKSGVPIAAPSANLSGRPSPTCIAHVITDLGGLIDAVIQGPPSKHGIESTVVDVTGVHPIILRFGSISPKELKGIISSTKIHPALLTRSSVKKPASPGMKHAHYAPHAELILFKGSKKNVAKTIRALVRKYQELGKRVGVLSFSSMYPSDHTIILSKDPHLASKSLYASLRSFDMHSIDIILSEIIPTKEASEAFMDRLSKAANNRVIELKG